jgi:hypothetical protein
MTDSTKTVRLRSKLPLAVVVASSLLSLFGFSAWIVNCDVALRFLSGGEGLRLRYILPSGLYSFLAQMAVDQSTVSTLLPAMLFGFPAFVGWWLVRGKPIPRWDDARFTPYPAWFCKFSISAGMFGTLLGMLFGLPSGTIGDISQSATHVQSSLLLLIEGFKTAVVSSIVGMVVSCFAQVFGPAFRSTFRPWLPVHTAQPLPDLLRDLVALAAAARSATERLDKLFGRVPEDAVTVLVDNVRAMNVCGNQIRVLLQTVLDQFAKAETAAARRHEQLIELIATGQTDSNTGRERFWQVLGDVCDAARKPTFQPKPLQRNGRHV